MNHQNSKQNNSSLNINCMSTIKTYIEYSSSNFQVNKKLFDLDKFSAGKLEINNFKEVNASLEKTRAIYFDKTIFSLLDKQKMPEKEYHYLFYILFLQENFRLFAIQLGHKNFCKFFRKFFNSCIKSSLFNEEEIAAYIDFYLLLLFQLITKSKNEFDFLKLKQKSIINLKTIDTVNQKYLKFLIKYILALVNVLDSTKEEYKDYQINIFNAFLKIEDTFFNEYYLRQLNKIFLKKGIYSFDNNFIQHILYPIIYKNNKKSIYDFSLFSSGFTNCILKYIPKYYNNKNNNILLYTQGSPFYFLSIPILINILQEMTDNNDLIQNLLFKFLDPFNSKINLFIDDDNKLKVAEYLLTDTINNKIIKNHLDIFEVIKPYFKINNNKNNNNYFEYLFYDLTIEKYISFYYSYLSDKNKDNNNNINDTSLNNSLSQSQDYDEYLNDNISKKKTNKNYIDLIIDKFNNTDNHFIKKYFNKIYDNNNTNNNINFNIDEFLTNINIEELFILLDIIYSISIKSNEVEIIKECILDVRKSIKYIISKSFKEKKFNCIIFNFINNIDKKYLPLSSEFDIMTSNTDLMNISFVDFIKTYPLFLIFVLNYYPKYNLEISQFFQILQSFMIGYKNNVFNQIDENIIQYNHTLQINYLTIVYIIIEKILDIYNNKDNNINSIDKVIIRYLPYCLNCQKKQKNPFILSKYLSKCIYCGENALFVNTNLYDYLINNKNEIKNFINECIFPVITSLTCNILYKFMVKYEKRNINSMFCYHLYYKIMSEHFAFLNNVKLKIGKNIPFIIDTNCEINNKEGVLEENIKIFFEKYITEKNKYPFKIIYETIQNDEFISFNSFRKTIKHESKLAKFKYNI